MIRLRMGEAARPHGIRPPPHPAPRFSLVAQKASATARVCGALLAKAAMPVIN
jgi:hypothetical protein